MKRNIIIMIVALFVSLSCNAQAFKAPSSHSTNTDSITTFTYEVSGNTYKVYKSSRKSFYIWRTSKKTGKKYKQYLPKEIQDKMKNYK